MRYLLVFTLLVLAALFPGPSVAKLVIADTTGSAYITGNSLPASTLAVSMGADILKLDVALTNDNQVVVFPSPYLEEHTNVAELFAEQQREDSHYYLLDFTLKELQQLTLLDEKAASSETETASPHFLIRPLTEHLSLIHSLEQRLNKPVDIAVTLVKPWLHTQEGRDLTTPVVATLARCFGSGATGQKLLLSYDVEELRRIAKTMLPKIQVPLLLVQLIDQPEGQESMVKEWGEIKSYNYDLLFSNSGLRALTSYVAAIGIPKPLLQDVQQQAKIANFIRKAQQLGTMIFTYPVKKIDSLDPTAANSFAEELEHLYFTTGVDGVITPNYGDVLAYLEQRQTAEGTSTEQQAPLPDALQGETDPLNLVSPVPTENE